MPFKQCIMKTILIAFVALIGANTLYAQSKTASAQTTKTAAKPAAKTEPESPLTASTAGKFAKDLGKRMYNTDPTYGDRHQGFNMQIQGWKAQRSDDGTWWYLVKLDLAWQEGTGGPWDWKDVRYTGTMIADEFGCNAMYLIDTKTEPSVLGILKRVTKLTDEQKEILSAKHEWTANVQYGWGPGECLEE